MSNVAAAKHAPAVPLSAQQRPAPFQVGGDLALDFLNSRATPRGDPVEWLEDGQDLVHWLVGADALASTEAARVASRFKTAALDRMAAEALALREWFRGALPRAKARGAAALSSQDLKRLNDVLARGSSYPQVQNAPRSRRPRLVTEQAWRTPGELLVPVALAMAHLLCDADLNLVRKCKNPSCTIWFYDHTKGHRRRWCTQAVCGNRAKVAAFRERERHKRHSK